MMLFFFTEGRQSAEKRHRYTKIEIASQEVRPNIAPTSTWTTSGNKETKLQGNIVRQ